MLVQILDKEARGSWGRVIATAAVSGGANAAILAVVNAAAQGSSQSGWLLLALFVASVALYSLCFRQSVGRMSRIVEAALSRLRIRMADQIRQSELLGIEQIGASDLYERLTHQTSIISNAAWPLAMGLQAAVMLACTVLYLTATSREALVITLIVYGIGGVYYYFRSIYAQQLLQETATARIWLFELLSDMLNGFKEARFTTKLSDDLQSEFSQVAKSLGDRTVSSNLLSQENYAFANLNQFALMGLAVFVLPQFFEFSTQTTMEVISALIFMFGPLGAVMIALPEYSKAALAAKNIQELAERLEGMASSSTTKLLSLHQKPFAELRLEGVEFQRRDTQGQPIFSVGSIDLTVKAGEIVFLVGGNGSGKTTLLRTMTALYAPTAGRLLVNGEQVTPYNVQSYRELIAAIFTDFHLFRKLYGLSDTNGEQVQKMLDLMQIAHKTQLIDGHWTTINLSTGQRKRIAMVVALLQDRPIYVFDEWAADQDPEFRHYFYEELLQDLKRRGKAVIAISHDDRFFRCADKVITLEYGKVRSIDYPRGGSAEDTTSVESPASK